MYLVPITYESTLQEMSSLKMDFRHRKANSDLHPLKKKKKHNMVGKFVGLSICFMYSLLIRAVIYFGIQQTD